MASRSLKLLASLLIAALAVLPASAQNDPALTAKLESQIAGFHGKVSLYAKDLATGQTVTIDADQPVPTASVIKLTVLYTALQQIREGRVHFGDKLTLRKQDQVSGSGVLLFFDTPLTLTLKDALTLMIAVSDNTATNLAIDHLGLHAIDAMITAPPPTGLDLHNTRLYKKVYQPTEGPMPADQPKFGLGKTTAHEMASVMERFVTCSLGPRPAAPAGAGSIPSDQDLCDAAMHMLKVQQDREMIPRHLEAIDTSEKDSAIADKIGTLDHVRNDVGAVYTKHGIIVISAFTHDNADTSWTPDNQAELLIAKMAKEIVDAWVPNSDHPAPAK